MNSDRRSPYSVTTPDGTVRVLVMDKTDQVPTTFALMATNVPHRVAIRVSGGCKGMELEDRHRMHAYFAEAFGGYCGMISSGATRDYTDDGDLNPMVTDVPGIVAAGNPECVALGTAPRTDFLRLVDQSRLVLNEWGTGPNPSMSAILMVQNGAEGEMDWDGDLDAYFKMMHQLAEHAGFQTVGMVAWNGGAITRDEIMRSARAGWPTIVVDGSGREADNIARQLRELDRTLLDELPNYHQLVVADASNPQTLRDHLLRFGFIEA